MLNKLSVVIITKNEENYIVNAVKSSKFADEVLVVDSGSTDKTCSLAKENGADVFYRKWEGYGSQKNYAVSLAKNN